MEPLHRNGSNEQVLSLGICAKSLKVLQIQGYPSVCHKTPTSRLNPTALLSVKSLGHKPLQKVGVFKDTANFFRQNVRIIENLQDIGEKLSPAVLWISAMQDSQ